MEEEDAGGFAEEIAEVGKKLQDCRSKYQTTEMKLKEASWSRCASGEFDSLRVDLKDAISQVEALKTSQTKQDQFDSMLAAVEGREGTKWSRWSTSCKSFHCNPSSATTGTTIPETCESCVQPWPFKHATAASRNAWCETRWRWGRTEHVYRLSRITRNEDRTRTTSLPKFFGDRRSYWRWKSNWGTLQALAEPTGSPECRLFHLMDSIADPVKCELRLSHCRTATEVFRVLEDCYGDVSQIADDIVLELQELLGVRNNRPREVLQLIQAVERALLDLIDLGCEDAIKNQLVIWSLESKLPDSMKERWLLYRCDPVNDVSPQNRFDKLWQFLKDQKTVLVQLEQLQSIRQSNTARAADPSPREKPKERPDRRMERRSFTKATASETRGPEDESCLKELPVLMMLLDVTTKRGDWIGALIDLASDTNYITHQAAERLGLTGEPITLVVHGVGGMEAKVETKRYLVSINVATKKGTWRLHEMVCYGLEEIANVGHVMDSEHLEKFFPGSVEPGELIRPEKIELLISTREGLAPQRMMRCGDLVLWDGPLGKTISGAHPDLFEDVEVTARFSSTHFGCSMKTESQRVAALHNCCPKPKNSIEVGTTNTSNAEIIKWLQWDSIGAACDPVCGGCRCGKCAPGGKETSLADERELEIIRGGLTFKLSDNHSDKPNWDAKYPWKEDPATLPNNRKAVEATFLKSEKRLEKDPLWKAAYAKQVRDMLARGAVIQLSQTVLDEWKGAVWWINHLMAPNPHSNTTPVRLVWDSSQVYKGVSLNSILMKGPDVLNPIRAVLLHFQEGEHAAIGDVSKMYNSVWLEDQEMHVHRFLWRHSPEENIKDYAVVRVNMGDKPAVAMRETVLLPQFVNRVEERRVIEEDTYVDDILVSHNDPKRLSKILEGVETILKHGGFYLKPWVRSGFSGRQGAVPAEPETIMLPNQLRTKDNKALRLGYLVEEDKLFLMVAINFSTRKKKMHTQVDLTEENIEEKTPTPLTRRMLLSQLFEEYARLSTFTFPRSITPSGWVCKPWGITFSDGSCDSYGAVLCLRWETSEGVKTWLVESKAKLTPNELKGDAVKAEICGAVFATRLKGYLLKYGRLEIDRWYHFLDSQTVLGAIQWESYGFQTFFANRVGEIQKAGPVTDWWWLPGQFNVADLVTRGCSPEQLGEDSSWQTGPMFLTKPIDEWPIKSAAEVASGTREVVSRLQRKAFYAILTRSQERVQTTPDGFDSVKAVVSGRVSPELLPFSNKVTSFETEGSPSVASKVCRIKEYWGSALINQVDLSRFNSLAKLCGVIAYVHRVLRFWLSGRGQTAVGLKWEAVPMAQERVEAFQDLCLAAQAGVTFPTTTLNCLVVRKDKTMGLLMCYGRIQSV
ncbi:unnamed protein product [Oreochromis niloticus]|nr:unnamed protein product [Mustela putorius furo]